MRRFRSSLDPQTPPCTRPRARRTLHPVKDRGLCRNKKKRENKKSLRSRRAETARDRAQDGRIKARQSQAHEISWERSKDQSCSFNQTNFQPAPPARTRSPLSASADSGQGCEARLGGVGLGGGGGYELWGTAVTGGEFTCLICCQRLPNAASINIPSGWITTGRLKRHWSSAMTSRSGLALNPANALRIFLPNIHQRERSLTTFPTLPDSQCAQRPSETRGACETIQSSLFCLYANVGCVCVCGGGGGVDERNQKLWGGGGGTET